jgi:hypothetical protein
MFFLVILALLDPDPDPQHCCYQLRDGNLPAYQQGVNKYFHDSNLKPSERRTGLDIKGRFDQEIISSYGHLVSRRPLYTGTKDRNEVNTTNTTN